MPLLPRQTTTNGVVVVPATYGGWSSLGAGAIVGITLGAVAGFLLVLWMVYTCLNFGRPVEASSSSVYTGTASVVSVRRQRSKSRHRHRKHRSPRARVIATEEVRVRESVSRPPAPGGPIIVEAAPPPPMQERRHSRAPPPRIVTDDEEDEVVVIEEHSPSDRRRRRHSSSRRHSHRGESRRGSRDY
ncbi:hypothetical protein CPAR01_10916 [Colletotrichum paranaense]|uniref:Uncharacterized protein n=7 Tax=Colletotrichum acutatum species complex TaxID=2707335 RepID=A0A9Q0AXL2_9PEZI|nr:uncharacterized protein CLUP02_15135 [Colletotrichum lupini]XP_060310928.1 uncharacterized protein CCOS01_09605 [Colletotrichum costaricense]XP_060345524.1 uncharacterized protein CPAR01_10916 [Colletotrichum paranaense]XP_060369582.1 uncharacterized protein BDZ83DRAFT_34683 [Colletotrichum acutatum]XP_060386159.1 uncharacterized protein CTAM01_03123 [Colletotrichum tamarilloi]XP_060389659.1 uncharacterized protein CABS01_04626 [Colletotrichum abscissum]KAI3544522.1 hypothetical protein CS